MFGRLGIVGFLFGFYTSLCAQDTAVKIDFSNFTIQARNNNGLGSASKMAIEYPSNSTKSAVKKMDFWVTGMSSNKDTVAVVADVFGNKSSWVQGPFAISGPRNHVSIGEWNPFLQLSRSEIEYHKSHFKDKNYQPILGIQDWPSNYSVNGFPKVLAGFVDVNLDGFYTPNTGDYPFVPGQRQLFTLASDSAKAMFPAANATPLDLAVLWYRDDSDSTSNTLFFRTTLCNRGVTAFDNVKISAVTDFALGDQSDNLLSTDAAHNALIGYNKQGGDAIYGLNPPAVVIGWLSRQASNTMYFENIQENVKGFPVTQSDFYQLSNSRWKTGKHLSFGSNGLDGTNFARFVYSNGTDTAYQGKDWDETPGNEGHRTGLISTGGWTISPGACVLADGHITIIPDDPDSAVWPSALNAVEAFYKKQDYALGFLKPQFQKEIQSAFFPNPVKQGERIYVKSSTPMNYTVFSVINSQLVWGFRSDALGTEITLPAGVYVVVSQTGISQKLMVMD